MAKGIRITEENVRAAFKEAGYEKVEVSLEAATRGQDKGTKLIFELPTGVRGVVNLWGRGLPENLPARRGFIKGLVKRARSATMPNGRDPS